MRDYCGNGNWKGELMLDYFLLKLRGGVGSRNLFSNLVGGLLQGGGAVW